MTVSATTVAPSPQRDGDPYTDRTASMPADSEARHRGDVASESSFRRFPLDQARCATGPAELDWVPDRETPVVPETMTALCRRCPARADCLTWALRGHEQGYWAGTTTADRHQMQSLGRTDLDTADHLQAQARRERTAGALHPAGEGSYWWYRRRRCRCAECRAGNAARRAAERARTTPATDRAVA